MVIMRTQIEILTETIDKSESIKKSKALLFKGMIKKNKY